MCCRAASNAFAITASWESLPATKIRPMPPPARHADAPAGPGSGSAGRAGPSRPLRRSYGRFVAAVSAMPTRPNDPGRHPAAISPLLHQVHGLPMIRRTLLELVPRSAWPRQCGAEVSLDNIVGPKMVQSSSKTQAVSALIRFTAPIAIPLTNPSLATPPPGILFPSKLDHSIPIGRPPA
jgi:hypothetical protein